MPQKRNNIILLGLVSFFNDVSSEMIAPILPMLITQLGGGGIVIGIIGGLRDSLSLLLNVFFGTISDRTGKKKPFVYGGYLLSNLFKFGIALAQSWHHILLFIGLDRIGKAMRQAPRDTLISQSSQHNLGRGFGIHRAFDTAGAILGSVIAFWLMVNYAPTLSTFVIIAGVIGLLSIIPLSFVSETNGPFLAKHYAFNWTLLPKKLKIYLIIEGLFAFGNVNYMFLLLKAESLYMLTATSLHPIFLYVLFNAAYASAAIPLGIVSDKSGRWSMIISGYCATALTCAGFATVTDITLLPFLFVIYGISLAINKVIQRAFVADASALHIRATMLGLFSTTTGITMLTGGLCAGVLWEYCSPFFMFSYNTCIALTCMFLALLYKEELTTPTKT